MKISSKLNGLPTIKLSQIEDLQGNLKDLNKTDFEKLKTRIDKHGFKYPLYLWKHKGKYYNLDGNQRKRVIMSVWGDIELPYIEIEAKNEKDAKKEILAISSQYGKVTKDGFDEFAFDFELEDWAEVEMETTFDGWMDKEIPEAEEDNYSIPDEVKTNIQLGDLIEIGEHRLLCGDCTDKEQVGYLMGGEKADMLLTDLPYGVSYADKNKFLNDFHKGNRNQSQILNDHQKPEELKEFAIKIYTSIFPYMNKISSYYAFMPQGGEQMMMMMALKESGFLVKHELIWVKNNHVLGRTDYNYKHEPICFGWLEEGTHKFYGGFKTSILEFDRPTSSKEHPTMKPIQLIAELIKNSSDKNQTVIDPTIGSGTTMIAAHQLNRKCYGMELDPRYCQVIIDRMQKLDPNLEVKINGEVYAKKEAENVEQS